MADMVVAARGIAFAATLAVIAAEDAMSLRVPDRAIAIGLLFSVLLSGGLTMTVLGAATGYTLFALVWSFRPESLGLGDVKLGIYLGAVLGPWRLWTAVAVSSVSALIVFSTALFLGRIHRDTPLPFAPFLAFGGLLSWGLSRPIAFTAGMVS